MNTQRNFNSISRENNINAVRYYLALCIMLNHFCVLTGFDTFQLPRIFGGAGSFFAISGFLMFPSFEKNSDTRRYLTRRARRIFPPYFLIVLVAAFVCVLFSDFSPKEYFLSSGFWKYLVANLSFLNFLAPSLPGVFTEATNNVSAVNGALWTMKGEVACYLTVPLIFLIVRRYQLSMRKTLTMLMAFFAVLYFFFQYRTITTSPGMEVAAKQCLVMLLFYMGAYLNSILPMLLKHARLLIILCGIILIGDYINASWPFIPEESRLPAFVHYCLKPFVSGLMVICCSLTGNWGKCLAGHEAFTYEIYLFHYPVIQAFITLGWTERLGVYPSFVVIVLLVGVLAYLSCRYFKPENLRKLVSPAYYKSILS